MLRARRDDGASRDVWRYAGVVHRIANSRRPTIDRAPRSPLLVVGKGFAGRVAPNRQQYIHECETRRCSPATPHYYLSLPSGWGNRWTEMGGAVQISGPTGLGSTRRYCLASARARWTFGYAPTRLSASPNIERFVQIWSLSPQACSEFIRWFRYLRKTSSTAKLFMASPFFGSTPGTR